MAGCKVAIISVEGGSVTSDSGTCVAGMICIVDVDDPDFYQIFEAVPDEGWYFHKWNSGYRFFCGGSINAACTLSFQGYEESEGVQNMVASHEMFYLMPVFKDYPRAVAVDGKAWLQPKDFVGYSYNQVSAVCPGGVCSGALPGSTFDLTGYTWASIDDVTALFAAYQKADRSILNDFAYTSTDRYHSIYLLLAMLSDPPTKIPPNDDDVYCYQLVTSGPEKPNDATPMPFEIHHGEFPDDASDMRGQWFWK